MTIEESVPNIEDNFWIELIYFSTRLSLSFCKIKTELKNRFEFIDQKNILFNINNTVSELQL